MSINLVILEGNLTKDPEMRHTQDGTSVCGFGMAINEKYTDSNGGKKESVTFVNISTWRKSAENCVQYLSKGDTILVEGKLKQNQWVDKDGNKRSTLEVTAHRVHFVKTKGKHNNAVPETQEPVTNQPETQEQDDVDSIPF